MTPAFRNMLALLLVTALVIRVAAGWLWQSRLEGPFGMGDSDSYWTLALTIAEGKPYEYGPDHARVFRTPGYPILLAPILRFAGDGRGAVLWARAEAALLGVLAVACVWWLTRLLFDDRAALITAALATFYPGAIAASMLILSEAPFCPLLLFQLALWTMAWRAETRRQATIYGFCGGLAAGVASLMRPSWLLFTPLAAAVGVLLGLATPNGLAGGLVRRDGGVSTRRASLPAKRSATLFRHLEIASWMLLGLAVAMLPWWVRNAGVTGQFVPTTLQVGASLYDGLNPQATGGSNMDFVPQFESEQRQASARAGDSASQDAFEVLLDRRMRDAAIAWAVANPGRAVRLAGVKFLRIWNVWPNEPRLSSWPIRLVVFFTYTPLLFLAIIGGWRTVRRGWPYVLCWLPAVYLTLLHMVFVSSIRYRDPAMLALLALAAGEIGIWEWGCGLGIRNWGLGTRD